MLKKVFAIILVVSLLCIYTVALPVNASGYIFSDDFDGNSTGNGWSELDNTTNASYGVSATKKERSDDSGNYALNLKTPKFNRSAGMNEAGYAEQYAKADNWNEISDYTMTFDMNIQNGQHMGFIVRNNTSTNTFYNIQLDFSASGTNIYLLKNQKLTIADITTSTGFLCQSASTVAIAKGSWCRWRISLSGNAITVSVNGAECINYEDTSDNSVPQNGNIGFYAGMSRNSITDISIDNVKVSVASSVDSSFFDGADFSEDFTLDAGLSDWDYESEAVEVTENGVFKTLRLKGIIAVKNLESSNFVYKVMFDAPASLISFYYRYTDSDYRCIDVTNDTISLKNKTSVLAQNGLSLNSEKNTITIKVIGSMVFININGVNVIRYNDAFENEAGKFAISSGDCVLSAVAITNINIENKFMDDFESYTASETDNFDKTDSPWTTIFDDAGEQTNVATNTITGYHLSNLVETGPNYAIVQKDGDKVLQMKNASIDGRGGAGNSYIRTGDNTWSDYTYSIDVKNGSVRSEFMFIMFRISGKKQYYALSLTNLGKLTFCKNAAYNGEHVIATGLSDFSVTIKAVGRYIAVYLNGASTPTFEYFDSSDTPNLSGGVGFGMVSGWDKPDNPAIMYFDDVTVEHTQNPFSAIKYNAEGTESDILETGSVPQNSNGISFEYRATADTSVAPVVSVYNSVTNELMPYTVLSSDESGIEIEFTEQLIGSTKCKIIVEQLLLTDNTYIKESEVYVFTIEPDLIEITNIAVNTDVAGKADVEVLYSVNKNQITSELMIIALYCEEKMVQVQAITNLNSAGGTVNAIFDIAADKTYSVKVYCWDNIAVRNAISETVSTEF